MTLLPLAECCHLLAIDPKTLRHWVRLASMSLVPHPTDARVKCLTQEQVQQVAAAHARPIALPEALTHSPLVESLSDQERPTHTHLPEIQLPAHHPETDLLGKLSHLETQVATLQQQLTALALELLQERTQRYEHRLQTLEALIQAPDRQAVLSLTRQMTSEPVRQEEEVRKERRLHPAEIRARSRVLPLIEYGTAGTYVVICPQDGELLLTPDSPAWFDWLATLSSFRFVGKQGRFTACRGGSSRSPKRTWFARRSIHHHNYKHYLGVTDRLTIDCLEQGAATLQAHVAAL